MWNKKNKVWYVLYTVFAKKLPISRRGKVFKKVRAFFAKKIINSMGENVNIERGACFNPEVRIGNNSGIGVNCELNGNVTIGNNVLMGPEVVFYTQNHEFSDIQKTIIEQGYKEERPIIIEDDCWIGRRAIILPGVRIAKGTIIGAGAIVTKSFPQYSIIAGNPAKIIGKRGEK